jgi:hypothetical protein
MTHLTNTGCRRSAMTPADRVGHIQRRAEALHDGPSRGVRVERWKLEARKEER